MRQSWYRIRNKTTYGGVEIYGSAEIYLYDEIGAWGVSASDFVRELRALTADNIDLHLNSPGGDVFDGIAIYNALREHPAKVNVYIDALAASAASLIVQAGDTRTIAKTAALMIHEPYGAAMGDSAVMLKMAEELDMIGDTIAEIYADRAGGKTAEWRDRMGEETWYRGQQAVDAGLADAVAEKPTSNAIPQRVFNLARFKHVPSDVLASCAQNAGRTMNQSNLDRLHAALGALDGVHEGTCDMGEECPMDAAVAKAEGVQDEHYVDDVIAAIAGGLRAARMEILA